MSKQYGLILPGEQKKVPTKTIEISKPSIFDESSDSDDGRDGPPQTKEKAAPIMPGGMERRLARRAQEKALAEDPTVFQYDELYDEMDSKRQEEKQMKSNDPKKPKYIARLMECAERRKLENELRVERQVQKEREQEGEQFKDKESFVTAAYRQKLEEMRLLEVQEKREEYLESIGDVTKQQDLDGFYRHLYEQKLGSAKEVHKPGLPVVKVAAENEVNAYKPIKSSKPQQRAYRKRNLSDIEADQEPGEEMLNEQKKAHLQNNIDADSDFSIDSSSDEDEVVSAPIVIKSSEIQNQIKDTKNTKIPCENAKVNKIDDIEKANVSPAEENTSKEPIVEVMPLVNDPPKPKVDKSEIWKKRTVGENFKEAVKRYYQRRATRSA